MNMLANHVWQSTLVLACVWFLTRTLRHNRAAVRHRLWLAASLKFLVPFDVLINLGRHVGPGVSGIPSLPLAQMVEIAVEPFSHPTLVAATRVVNDVGPGAREFPAGALLLGVWAVGFVAVLAGWTLAWCRTASLARQGRAEHDGISEVLSRINARRGHTPIRLAVCDTRVEPGVFGIWRPVLLWPRALTRRLSDQEVEAILAHELCHVRRRDNLSSALHTFVNATFWFYPVVRMIGTQLHIERERACDEEVLRAGYPPRTYAESIVKTCEFCIATHAMTVTGATGSLRTRVAGILEGHVGAMLGQAQRIAIAGLALGAVTLPITIGVTSALPLRAQQPVILGSVHFTVASIRPHRSAELTKRIAFTPGGRFTATNVTLKELMRVAFGIQSVQVSEQIVGGPQWIESARFDLTARATDDSTSENEWTPTELFTMVRTLLADRFRLATHSEMRELPIYELTQARGDQRVPSQLRPSAIDCTNFMTNRRGAAGVDTCGFRVAPGRMTGPATMAQFAMSLAPVVGRVVVDRTHLTGEFDVDVTWSSEQPELASGAFVQNGSSIFTALREQLELTLEASRGPVEVLVIDSVERPTPD